MNKKYPLIYMLVFYLADIILLGLLSLIASTKDPQLSLWFGEQGLAGYLWFFSSIIIQNYKLYSYRVFVSRFL